MPGFTLRAADAACIPAVQRLAEAVWYAHYQGIITTDQIAYMLARGYATDALQGFVDAPDGGIELAQSAAGLLGFAAWMASDERSAVKLDKLYVDVAHQRAGVGRALIERVVGYARDLGANVVVLNVNKHNTRALAAYRRNGFVVRESAVVDIGGGFVMDDYVMARSV
ncbi:MAG: GNAT family N-acetyltransferase [Casimicrobiaceae bacterium]